jgi:hypothetical protein
MTSTSRPSDAEAEQAMLRHTIEQNGRMIAEADRLIAASRPEPASPRHEPRNPAT